MLRGFRFSREDFRIAATKRIRRNEEIDATEVRVIDAAGEQAGVMSLTAAIQVAKDVGLDLVEVSPNAASTGLPNHGFWQTSV